MDPRQESLAYLEQRRVCELFAELGALLAHRQPPNPAAFLLEELRRIEGRAGADYFHPKDFAVMFGLLDVTRRGHISGECFARALGALKGEPADRPEEDCIDSAAFVRLMCAAASLRPSAALTCAL